MNATDAVLADLSALTETLRATEGVVEGSEISDTLLRGRTTRMVKQDVAAVGMSEAERKRLGEQVRREERVAKTSLKQRSARLKADMEQQLAARFRQDDERWRAITTEAKKMVEDSDAKMAAICREMGVREEFRPSLSLGWYGRGENASKERRAELRRVGEKLIDEQEAAGKVAVERRSVEIQRELLAGGLQSEDARAFLMSMPTAEQLLPPLSLAELDEVVPVKKLHEGYGY